jgi:ELWxxDGT repeat protein
MTKGWLLGGLLATACGLVNAPASPDAGVTEDIDAMPGSHALRVEVTGLVGSLVLRNGGGDDLTITADGVHRFATDVLDGATFDVSVASDPILQNCHVAGASGTVAGADLQLAVRCTKNILMWIDDNPDGNAYNHEIWMSDHTAAGTGRSVNIHPDDTEGSGPSPVSERNGLLYLVSNDGTGTALFRTDGTQANTVKLRAFDGIDFGEPLLYNGAFYFSANGDANGTELWWYDGSNFSRLTDIVAGSGGAGFWEPFVVLRNRYILFRAQDATTGDNPWSYDTQGGGAVRLVDAISGAFAGQIGDFVVLGNRAYFPGDTVNGGNNELYFTDGTVAGTGVLKELNPSTSSSTGGSFPRVLGSNATHAFFSADDGTTGREPWVTDGTSGGTVLLRNIASGGNDSDPSPMIAFAGKLWFTATDENGNELWSTDGTTVGTVKLEVNPSPTVGSSPSQLTVVGDRMYFVADGGDGAGQELWFTDGTTATRVTDVVPGQDAGVGQIGPWDGRVLWFFNASYDTTELWTTDGTSAGTTKVKDLCAAPMCNPYAQFILPKR